MAPIQLQTLAEKLELILALIIEKSRFYSRTLLLKGRLGKMPSPINESTLDLSRFDAAPLIAFTATKEMKGAMCAIGSSTMASGTETDGRIPARCGADRTGQRTDA